MKHEWLIEQVKDNWRGKPPHPVFKRLAELEDAGWEIVEIMPVEHSSDYKVVAKRRLL